MTANGTGEPVIEDIFPLTAVQQGMLVHTLRSGTAGMYSSRYEVLLDSELDHDVFRRACDLVFAWHPMLRAAVVWEDVPEPLWVVSQQVSTPLEIVDDTTPRPEVDLTGRSLVKVTLAGRRLIWSYHHAVLDGWSVPIVLRDLFGAYDVLLRGAEPAAGEHRPFRDHVNWVRGRDADAAERYWRERLNGFTEATPLTVTGPTRLQGNAVHRFEVDAVDIAEFARRHRLTLNTVVQGAFALLLARYSGEDDVVFGVTSSGRSEELDGVDTIVGSLITTSPARVRVEPGETVVPFLRRLQAEQVAARQFEHTPLTRLQSWTAVPNGRPLFDAILVFGNYPQVEGPGIVEVRRYDRNNYPLTVGVAPGAELAIELDYDRALFEEATIRRMAGHLATLLSSIAAGENLPISRLGMLTPPEPRGLAGPHTTSPARTVLDLITPHDGTAVICGERSLSYRELDDRSGRLAADLSHRGVRPDDIVG
ncbi:condensation domain-containing protein, partial [Micromonospora chersina]|uniref:condensation domain-containing protein n=1 Tax=Micromonospora chersina TaxID=47854 RepID=UPI0037158806